MEVTGREADMDEAPKRRPNWLGAKVAGTYAVLVAGLFALTAHVSTPSDMGYGWIPLILLAMPWTAARQDLLIAGLILNTGILFLVGTIVGSLRGTTCEKE
jgi:bacteriorhodopsin